MKGFGIFAVVLGLIMLTLGVFTPVISHTLLDPNFILSGPAESIKHHITESFTFWKIGQWGKGAPGIVVLSLAGLATLCLLIRWYAVCWFFIAGIAGQILYTNIGIKNRMDFMYREMTLSLPDNQFVKQVLENSHDMGAGWALMLGGDLLLAIGLFLLTRAKGKKKCPFCAEDIKAEALLCKHCGKDLPTVAEGG